MGLWDFCCGYTVELRNRLARPLPQLHGRTPWEKITGNTPDISEFLEFQWYEPIWYYEPTAFPEERRLIARWIGVAHRVGQAMCYWILPVSGVPIARTTIQKISNEDLKTEAVKAKLKDLDRSLHGKFNDECDVITPFQFYRQDVPEDLDDDEVYESESSIPNEDDIEPDAYDELLLTEPTLMYNGQQTRAKIIARKRDADGNLVGTYNSNPILNT